MAKSKRTSNIKQLAEEKPSHTHKIDEHEIVERIYTAVLDQRLPPNTKLNESMLCESMGVGRMRVRRALLLLASQGIVELHSNRGAFIACPDNNESKDVFGARLALEPSIVKLVAEIAREKDFVRFEQLIKLEQQARESGDRRESIKLSGEFHVQLATVTGNTVLRRMVRELVARTSLIVGMFGTPGANSCPEHEHLDIVNALRSRDADLAAELVRKHLQHIEASLDLSANENIQLDLVTILGGKR